MNTRAMKSRARDRKLGMTLEEVSAFVIDAQHLGIPGDTKVEVLIGFSSNIKQLAVEGVVDENNS